MRKGQPNRWPMAEESLGDMKEKVARQGYLDLFASALGVNDIHFPGHYIIGAEVLPYVCSVET